MTPQVPKTPKSEKSLTKQVLLKNINSNNNNSSNSNSSPRINSYMSSDSSQLDVESLSPLSDAPPNRGITNLYTDGYISSPSMSISKSETQDSIQWKFGSNMKGPIDFSPKKIVTNLFSHPEEDVQTNFSTTLGTNYPNYNPNSTTNTNTKSLCDNIPNDKFRAAMRNVESKILQDSTLIVSSGLLDMAIQANSFQFYQKVFFIYYYLFI